jgi:putative salt-induced outer membrane protein YdiY
MKRFKIIIALLAALTGLPAARAAADTGTKTIVTIRQGTNVITTIIQGTNAVVTIQQGTNPVATVVQEPKSAIKPPPTGWQSTAAAGLTYTRGNSDILLFTAKIQSQKKDLLNEWLLEADATYGENDSVNNADSLHGSAQYNRIFSDRFYGFDNADALHDGIQNLKYRASMSPGVGYYFIKDKSSDLVGEIGPSGVAEDRGDMTDYFLSLRIAEHYDQKLSDTTKLWEKAEFIPEVKDLDDYIMNVEVGVETAITKRVSLQLTLDDAYVNRPAPGRKSSDIKLVSGIAYKF